MTGELAFLAGAIAAAGLGLVVWLLWRLTLGTERIAAVLEISHAAELDEAARQAEAASPPPPIVAPIISGAGVVATRREGEVWRP